MPHGPLEPPFGFHFTSPAFLLIVSLLACAAFLAYLVATVLRHRRQREVLRAQIDLQARLLDKVRSSEEMRVYLESEAVRQFAGALGPRPEESYQRVLGAAVKGCAFTVMGLGGLMVVPGRVKLLAAVALIAGIAFLVSALVTYLLSKSWGLLRKDGPTR